jgi:spore coat polysaccharide biosynthesis predicted glycosyltransferase SpsG
MIKIFFIYQSSPEIGLGHKKRCEYLSCLVKKKIKKKIKFYFINLEKNRYLKKKSFFLKSEKFNDRFLENLLHKHNPNFIFFDLIKTFNIKKLNFIKKVSSKIVLIGVDQLIKNYSFFDKFIFPYPFVKNKKKIISNSKNFYYGWNSIIINPKIKRLKFKASNKLLITIGGSDKFNLGKIIPKYVDQIIKKKMKILWLNGPFAKKPIISKQSIHDWKIVKSYNIQKLFEKSDYVFTTYGLTYYESIFSLKPTVVFTNNKSDNIFIKKLSSLGMASYSLRCQSAIKKLEKIIYNSQLCYNLIKNYKKYCKKNLLPLDKILKIK